MEPLYASVCDNPILHVEHYSRTRQKNNTQYNKTCQLISINSHDALAENILPFISPCR